MKYTALFIVFFLASGCIQNDKRKVAVIASRTALPETSQTSLIILGTVQDAGSPHIACKKKCCSTLFEQGNSKRKVVSLGLLDAKNNKRYLFEATPDISEQLKALKAYGHDTQQETPDGVFLTHAHIGHYTGLMYFGKEAMNATKIPTYAMPRMKNYLKNNGPWNQLVEQQNIELIEMTADQPVQLSSTVSVTPFLVPHRDEYSETVGYTISGPNKRALFIPDIDKWEKWKRPIVDEIKKVDYAFIDATFFNGAEINTRDISEIPHPFVIESMNSFDLLSSEEKNKIIFIHFNHTNPLLDQYSQASKQVKINGFRVAYRGMKLIL